MQVKMTSRHRRALPLCINSPPKINSRETQIPTYVAASCHMQLCLASRVSGLHFVSSLSRSIYLFSTHPPPFRRHSTNAHPNFLPKEPQRRPRFQREAAWGHQQQHEGGRRRRVVCAGGLHQPLPPIVRHLFRLGKGGRASPPGHRAPDGQVPLRRRRPAWRPRDVDASWA